MDINDKNESYEDFVKFLEESEKPKIGFFRRLVFKMLGIDSFLESHIKNLSSDLERRRKLEVLELENATKRLELFREDVATLYGELRTDLKYLGEKVKKIKPVIHAEGEVKEVIQSYFKKFDDGFNTNQMFLETLSRQNKENLEKIRSVVFEIGLATKSLTTEDLSNGDVLRELNKKLMEMAIDNRL